MQESNSSPLQRSKPHENVTHTTAVCLLYLTVHLTRTSKPHFSVSAERESNYWFVDLRPHFRRCELHGRESRQCSQILCLHENLPSCVSARAELYDAVKNPHVL
jgi:hypothetical protein